MVGRGRFALSPKSGSCSDGRASGDESGVRENESNINTYNKHHLIGVQQQQPFCLSHERVYPLPLLRTIKHVKWKGQISIETRGDINTFSHIPNTGCWKELWGAEEEEETEECADGVLSSPSSVRLCD